MSASSPNVGWITLPRNLLEQEFDSLGLERQFENGIKDTAENVERLRDYPDYDSTTSACPQSGLPAQVNPDDRVQGRYQMVVCPNCRCEVKAFWKRSLSHWAFCSHTAPLVSESTDISMPSETNATSG